MKDKAKIIISKVNQLCNQYELFINDEKRKECIEVSENVLCIK